MTRNLEQELENKCNISKLHMEIFREEGMEKAMELTIKKLLKINFLCRILQIYWNLKLIMYNKLRKKSLC